MSKYFEVKGDNLKRKYKHCPKCGPGYFMAEHKDRHHCGKCGHMIPKK
ncbi:MAG: 30S ribosomal protein S27ae [Candidatus Heimdallarchaeota archaeon]|nr:30S ribosomal protein S27ae [Candidatus Heimdallarchaeota archaeon]